MSRGLMIVRLIFILLRVKRRGMGVNVRRVLNLKSCREVRKCFTLEIELKFIIKDTSRRILNWQKK